MNQQQDIDIAGPLDNKDVQTDRDTISLLSHGRRRSRNDADNYELRAVAIAQDTKVPTPSLFYEPLYEIPTGYPALDFKPILLRTWFLLVIFTLCMAALGGILAVDRLASQPGVGRVFHTSNDYQRLTWEYGPILAASLTKILFDAIFSALGRMTPYISMATPRKTYNIDATSGMRTLGTIYFPFLNIQMGIKNRHITYSVVAFVRVISLTVLTPLKSTFTIVSQDSPGSWNVTVSHHVALALCGLYFVLGVMTLGILFRLYNRSTGLKWDPIAISDQMALFHGSNVLADFGDIENHDRKSRNRLINENVYRLGYWRVSRRSMDTLPYPCHELQDNKEDIWYGIGRDSSLEDKRPPAKENVSRAMQTRENPYRALQFLQPWVIIVRLIVFIGLIVVLYVAATQHAGIHLTISLSLSTFIFRGLVVLFINAAGGIWMQTDLVYRVSQPFAGMYATPKPATDNILLHYPSDLPGLITMNAFVNKHYKVAYFSALYLGASLVPTLSGTLFTVTGDAHTSVASAPVFKAAVLAGVLVVFIVSLALAWPTKKRLLPRNLLSIADLLTYCHASELVYDPVLCVQRPQDTQRHLESKVFLAERLYLFGVYMGVDGREHVGFDMAFLPGEQPGREEHEHVVHVKPTTKRSFGGFLQVRKFDKDESMYM